MANGNGTGGATAPADTTKADQRAAITDRNAAEQEAAKQNVSLAVLTGKVVEFEPKSATEMWLLAQYYFAAKNCLPKNVGGVGDMFAKLMAGRSLGIDSMAAIRGIDVVEGKIFIEGDLAHAILNTKLDYSKGEYCNLVESTNKGATYEFKRAHWKEPRQGTFNEEDAAAAGLLTKQGPWQTYRKAMYRHRAMITWSREFFPEWFLGVYTMEEKEEFRELNRRPAEGISPATRAPTEVDISPMPGVTALPAAAQLERIEEVKPKEAVPVERGAPSAAAASQPAAEEPTKVAVKDAVAEAEVRVSEIVGKAETPDAFAGALGQIQNLEKTHQIQPRLSLIRQIDLFLQKPGNKPTAELGKLLFRTVSGLPDDQRELGQKVYNRYTWSKA